MPAITPTQLAEWRRALLQEAGSQFGDPTLSEVISEKLMAEIERVWRQLAHAQRRVAQEATVLEKRLADVSVYGGECQTCHNAEARAALVRLKRAANA
jgi:cytochrome c5